MRLSKVTAGVLIGCALFLGSSGYGEGEAAQLDWMTKVSTGGRHNAFTDLIHWKGMFYLCFRHGEHHSSMDGEIHVVSSPDMKTWEPTGVIKTFGDDRDPHFSATEDRLFVYFGTWDLRHANDNGTPNRGVVRSHTSSTTDGKDWTRPQGLYYPGWWMWRVRRLGDRFYSGAYTAIRPRPQDRETRLLSSVDGLNWEVVATVNKDHGAGESDMWFAEEGGGMTLLSRTRGNAVLYRSDSTLKKWEGKRLSGLIHSPAVVRWKDRTFVAGRGTKKEVGACTRIWELIGDDVEERLTLPSGGDTSYPGLLVDPASLETDTPGLFISWYSQADAETGEDRASRIADVYAGRVTIP